MLVLGGRELIRGLDLTLPDPGIYLLLGGNCSGKTVLAKVLSGRLQPARGQLVIDGEAIRSGSAGYSGPIFYAGASDAPLEDETLRTYFEAELLNAGGLRSSIRSALSELKDDLHIDVDRRLSELAHSELLLAQVLLASYIPLRLCVLDGHLTYLDRSHLLAADGILRRFETRQDRFIVLTAGRLAAGFPQARATYLLSGDLPIELLAKPEDAAIDTALNPVYGTSAVRVYVHGRPGALARLTSGEEYSILSIMEDGLRVQLKGSLDECLDSLRRQGLEIARVEWESLI